MERSAKCVLGIQQKKLTTVTNRAGDPPDRKVLDRVMSGMWIHGSKCSGCAVRVSPLRVCTELRSEKGTFSTGATNFIEYRDRSDCICKIDEK